MLLQCLWGKIMEKVKKNEDFGGNMQKSCNFVVVIINRITFF